jgi:hypothetical protein
MQMVVLVSGVLLLISDIRYHISFVSAEALYSLKGVGLLLLLVAMLILFGHILMLITPASSTGSYWIKSLPLLGTGFLGIPGGD